MAGERSQNQSNLKTSIPALHASSSESQKPKSPAGKVRSAQGKPAPDPRHLAIALHHAHHIQARKDTEALILSRIEDLLALPTSPTAGPSSPSPEDATALKSALRPFQPSDYDNLILERNIDGQCGYALCPRPHRKEDPKAKFRVVWGKKGSGPGGRGKEMKVVPKEQIEKWCSDECAERAMYIRVQLIEEPAWERANGKGVDIVLLEEGRVRRAATKNGRKGKEPERNALDAVEERLRALTVGENASTDPNDLTTRMSALDVDDGRSKQLAMERGDSSAHHGSDFDRVGVDIHENDHVDGTTPVAPTLDPDSTHGGTIEGFEPSLPKSSQRSMGHDDDEDEDNDILQCI